MLGIHWPYFTASTHIGPIESCMWSIRKGYPILYVSLHVYQWTFVPSGERVSSVVLQLCHTFSVYFNHLLSQDLLGLVSHVELSSTTHAGLSLLHHQQRLRVTPLRNTLARHSHRVKPLYLTVMFRLSLARKTFLSPRQSPRESTSSFSLHPPAFSALSA